MIKRDEQIAINLIKEYENYALSIINIKKKYDLGKSIKHIILEARKNGTKIEDFDFPDMIEFENKKNREIKLEEEKLKHEKEKLHSILNNFTQEMLVYIYNKSINIEFKNEVYKQIETNNSQINYLNNLASESGAIFQNLELMSKEELSRIISLRETTEEINIEKLKLQYLNLNIIKMISKVMNGQSLNEEKYIFCVEHNLSNEIEFQFYKKSIENKNLLDSATNVQKAINEFLNKDDNSVINYAYNNMSSINLGIIERKK